MKKLRHLTLFLTLALGMTAGAQTLVQDAATELTNGTVIALQCRDTNGGAGYYLNGETTKSQTFSKENLYVVVGNATDGLKLRRLTDNKYIGKSGTSVAVVEESAAVSFTAQSYGEAKSFTLSTATEMGGTVQKYYVRFTGTNGETYLNTNTTDSTPQYKNGTGGFSAWYVYKFDNADSYVDGEATTLSFNRTGKEINTVTVNVLDGEEQVIEGVEASLISCEHPATSTNGTFRATNGKTTEGILCPNVNGNTDPTIKMCFKLEKLPENFSFNQISLDIHALNGSDGYQQNDNVSNRQFNVKLEYGLTNAEDLTEWGTWTDIEIARGIGTSSVSVHKWWPLAASAITVSNGTLYLNITITKGSDNIGCFFGLSGIKFTKSIEAEANNKVLIELSEQLAKISAATANLPFPTEAEGVTSAIWPNEYSFTGLTSNFELINHAQAAFQTKDYAAAATATSNLAKFISLSEQHGYPKSVELSISSAEGVDYGTIYMPFNTSLPAGLKLYTCDAINKGVVDLTSSDNSFIKNKAYLVHAENKELKGNKYQFIGYSGQQSNTQANAGSLLRGVHENTPVEAGNYVLQNQDGVFGFFLIGEGTFEVPAHKCYLQLPATSDTQGVRCLLFPDGTTTSIEAVDAAAPAADAAEVYDLSGRRVSQATKGLYIVGGRKVFIK